MVWIVGAFVLSGLVAMIAAHKGRSSLKWFVYALLIFPAALIHVLLIRTRAATAPHPSAAQAEAAIAAKLRHPGDRTR